MISSAGSRGIRVRVLVVDDDEDTRTLLCMGLERMGLHAFSASSVAEARGCLAAPVDVLITDWHLGDGSAQALIDECAPLPVVLLTGDEDALALPWPRRVRALKKPASLVEIAAAARLEADPSSGSVR